MIGYVFYSHFLIGVFVILLASLCFIFGFGMLLYNVFQSIVDVSCFASGGELFTGDTGDFLDVGIEFVKLTVRCIVRL